MNLINCKDLPNELHEEIYSHISLNDHRLQFSKVCKSWKIIYLNDQKNKISQYFSFDDKNQLNSLFKIIEESNLIDKMIQQQQWFSPKSETIYPEQISLKCDSCLSIGWKQKRLKIKKYSKSSIGADYIIRLHLNYNRTKSHFSPEATLTLENFQTVKYKIFRYKVTSDKAMTHLLRHSLEYSHNRFRSCISRVFLTCNSKMCLWVDDNLVMQNKYHIRYFKSRTHSRVVYTGVTPI